MLAVFLPILGTASFPVHADVTQEIAQAYVDNRSIEAPAPLTPEEAERARRQLVNMLEARLGPRAGYKAALTSAAAQRRFGVTEPVMGVLMRGMLKPSGTALSTQDGARLVTEGDLVVRVGKAGLLEATTPREALAGLDAVYPFLELPDIMYRPGTPLTGPHLVAINAGARFGIIGQPVALQNTDEVFARLARIQLTVFDDDEPVASGDTSALMGHPLRVVLWLRDQLLARGDSLEPGDLLSLGTVTPLRPALPGHTVRARYEGLDTNRVVEISVQFNAEE